MSPRRSLSAALALACALAAPCAAQAAPKKAQLLGRAVLPAETFAPGPPSGAHIGPSPQNGVTVPFATQPVQGFSGAVAAGEGRYWVITDNGYGTLENSADFNLRLYLVKPNFKSALGGSGKVRVLRYIQLHDPDHKLPYAIVNQWTKRRVLTGADLDPESFQRAPDGTLWIGDEFGPFLVHVDTDGKVLDAPYPLPDPDHPGQQLRSPQNPLSEETAALRVMNALHADALAHGDRKVPIVSPNYNMIADGDPSTAIASRKSPPAGSGLKPASSELFDIKSLHAAGYKVVPWTVDDPAQMTRLLQLGVDGIISDRPDLLHQALANFDANGDGTPGDYLNPDGTVDASKFDAEAHRGGRDLRPENTLPSMEAGLDNLADTLETDNHLTRDGVPIISHDPYIDTGKCRRTDGKPYTAADEILIRDLTLAQIQSQFICDGIIRTGTPQTNDRSLSPVAVAFAKKEGLIDPYIDPTTQQLFDFVSFYADWYSTGPGASEPGAAVKAANARRVRFNIETKLNPRSDRDKHGIPFDQRDFSPEKITRAVAGVIEANHMQDRVFVQSFDFRTLRIVHREFPNLETVALFDDDPVYPGGTGEGTNMQPQGSEKNTRWMAGLPWPYRHTALENPFRVQASGGFEGTAITPNGRTLIPMLEKPLVDGPKDSTQAFAFSLRSRGYTGQRWTYPYDPRGISVDDFQLADRHHGLTLERDNTQGDLNGFKAVEEVTLGAPGTTMGKREAANLLSIRDPNRISLPAQPGDIGLGNPFAMPFITIEDVVILDRRHVLVINDNNFPFSVGRHVGSGKPDDDEFVVLRLPQRIGS